MASRFSRKSRLLAVGALAISALAAGSALAKGTTVTTTKYACVATPNPVTGAVTYNVSGSGFPAGMVVNLYIKDKISTWIVQGNSLNGGVVATDGTFTIVAINSSIFYPSNLGTKSINVTNANDRRATTLVSCALTVK